MPPLDRKAQDERELAEARLRQWFRDELDDVRRECAATSAAARRELMTAQAELDRLRRITLGLQVIERDPEKWVQ